MPALNPMSQIGHERALVAVGSRVGYLPMTSALSYRRLRRRASCRTFLLMAGLEDLLDSRSHNQIASKAFSRLDDIQFDSTSR